MLSIYLGHSPRILSIVSHILISDTLKCEKTQIFKSHTHTYIYIWHTIEGWVQISKVNVRGNCLKIRFTLYLGAFLTKSVRTLTWHLFLRVRCMNTHLCQNTQYHRWMLSKLLWVSAKPISDQIKWKDMFQWLDRIFNENISLFHIFSVVLQEWVNIFHVLYTSSFECSWNYYYPSLTLSKFFEKTQICFLFNQCSRCGLIFIV